MAYESNVPLGPQRIKDTQSPIHDNFTEIPALITINHYPFGDPLAGKHKYVQLPNQGGAPGTSATEGAIYSAQGATSTTTELVFQRQSNGAAIPFTEGSNANPGWLRLANGPGGILMKWGTVNESGVPATGTVNLNAVGPAYSTAPYIVQLSVEHGTSSSDDARNVIALVKAGSITSSQFVYIYGKQQGSNPIPDGPMTIHWFTIGKGT